MKLRVIHVADGWSIEVTPEAGDLERLRRRHTQTDEHGDPLRCSHEGIVAEMLQRDLEELS